MKTITKVIKYVSIVLFIVIIICVVYIKSSGILHIVDKTYSPDMLVKQVVYVYESKYNNDDFITIKEYKDNRYNTSISFSGQYDGIFWTDDSSKYAIKVKEYLSNIYVADKNTGSIIGIDKSLDNALESFMKNSPDSVDFTFDEKLIINYEFIQWEKDNKTILVNYEINDMDQFLHSGYFLYDFTNNIIMGILSSN